MEENEQKNQEENLKTKETSEPTIKLTEPTKDADYDHHKFNKGRAVIGFIGKLLAIIIIVTLVVIIVRALVFKRTDVLGYRFYMIMSGSMEPTINIHDAVIVKKADTYKTGDIVAFNHGNAVTVHRIIAENEDGTYQTQGDNNNAPDKNSITKDDIRGVYVNKISNLGEPITFLQTHIYVLIVIAVIIALIILARRVI